MALRCIYNVGLYLIQPVLLLLMLKRGFNVSTYFGRLGERYACYKPENRPQPNGIVIHAASVGEVIAATPLIKQIRADYPNLPITVTTITPTGSAQVKAAFGESVSHFYLPYDFPFAIRRFFNWVQPKLFIVMETELWPNLIDQAAQSQIPFVIINARLSPRSAKRYGWIKGSVQKMLKQIDLILTQDRVSAERYINLGMPVERLVNIGNLKFDLEMPPAIYLQIEQTRHQLSLEGRRVWIAGSTHEGEEQIILAAHQQLRTHYPDLVLILVPRYPERFQTVEHLIRKMDMSYVRRSAIQPLMAETSVLLGDTMGEMRVLYGLAHIAFVGGSLVPHGGHNPLEPIAFNLPVISGLHTFNFPEIFASLREVKGVLEIESKVESLTQAVDFLLKNAKEANAISEAGLKVLNENQGALQRHLEMLKPYLEK